MIVILTLFLANQYDKTIGGDAGAGSAGLRRRHRRIREIWWDMVNERLTGTGPA
jgi:hypothetical protein